MLTMLTETIGRLRAAIARRTEPAGDGGFTLAEMLVSSAIIIVSAAAETAAGRALAAEVETLNGIAYQHLLMAPSGTYTDCVLADGTASAQAVRYGAETVRVDGHTVTITREVRWHSDGSLATCGNADGRVDLKVVTVTAAWDDAGTPRQRTEVVQRSAAAETTPGAGATATQAATAPTNAPGAWCPAYPGGDAAGTQLGAGGTATTVPGGIQVAFAPAGTAVCGYTFTGLTPGATYTAVMDVTVPDGQTPVELAAAFAGQGGVAPADGLTYRLSVTWTENGTSRIVGPAPVGPRTATATAVVDSLVLYQH